MDNNMPQGMNGSIKFSGNFLPSHENARGMPTPGYGLVNVAPEEKRSCIDSSADPLGALALVSPEAARKLNERQQDIAEKRQEAADCSLLKRGLI